MSDPEDLAEVATDADLAAAVKIALASIGMTFAELHAEAAAHRFSSDRAQRVWVAISGLGRLA